MIDEEVATLQEKFDQNKEVGHKIINEIETLEKEKAEASKELDIKKNDFHSVKQEITDL